MASRNQNRRSTARASQRPQQNMPGESGRISSKLSARSYAQERHAHQASRPSQGAFKPASSGSSRKTNSKGFSSKSRNSDSFAPRIATPVTGSSNPYSRSNPDYSRKSKKQRGRGKKVALVIICALVLVIAGGGTAFAMYVNSINTDLAGTKSSEEMQAIDKELAVTSFSEPFYMMLIGSDARDDDSEMGQRSDTNILVRIDPTTSTVTMLSIPRDTRIEIDGYGTNKFNAAYNFGGAAGTIKEAGQLCNVKISHYAEVNFDQLIGLIDAVGGVEVNVPELINDPDAGNIVIQPGLQTLNGEAALTFARSRAYADGDFTRTSNQRLLIEALAKKVLALPATELPGAIQKAAKCVTTDMSVTDIFSLATQFKNLGNITIYSSMVPSSTTMIGDASYVIADKTTLAKMMKVIDSGGDPNTVIAEANSTGSTPSGGSGTSGTSGGYSATPPSSYSNSSYGEDDY